MTDETHIIKISQTLMQMNSHLELLVKYLKSIAESQHAQAQIQQARRAEQTRR